MQVTVLVGIALGAAVVVMLINAVQTRQRHRAMAKKLGCKPPIQAPSTEPSGIVAMYRGAKASKEKRFPQFVQEQFEKLNEREGRQVGTTSLVTPFFKKIIFTSDPQNIQAMLALKFKDFGLGVNRTDNFRPLLGNGIFAANGKQWEHSRALLRPQFVRSQVSDLDLEEAHVQNMMTVLNRHLGSDGWTGTVDLQVLFFRLTLDSATEFLFGESVNSQLDQQTDITNSGKDDDSFAYAFDRSQYILAIAARLGHNYWLMHTPEFHRMVERVHKFVDYFVQKAMTNRPGEKQAASDHYVFLHALAEQTQDPAELRSQLLNILLAGRDTTASLLGWFFHTLADKRYEPIYKRLRQIVVDEFGTYDRPRDISFERMKSCQYLQWCINEALRLYPVVPMNVRTALTDTTLPTGGGDDGRSPIFVPKGTDVGYSVFIMHRRKDLWGDDCDVFKPERWESRKPGWDYLPFNGGPRICIGQQFALTEIAYVLVRMLQRIDVLDGSAAGPVKHGLTLTNCPADGVKLRLHFAE
ncbi:Cytochrome P450 52A12 [Metarhizium brunneum]|uniref:Cytochrome P450 52A12 n=1 Tax=Metarhizium brunneum TaxID=500148 RepID=A0A7D5UYJ2_9HYPO